MGVLPVPEYTGPDGTLNLASRLPSFFIRPDLGPRLCCAHGISSLFPPTVLPVLVLVIQISKIKYICVCVCTYTGVTACPEQDFGTSNLHVEISDTMSILVYAGIAKGNGALSKSG